MTCFMRTSRFLMAAIAACLFTSTIGPAAAQDTLRPPGLVPSRPLQGPAGTAPPQPAGAPPARVLTLDEALRLAEKSSEEVTIAEAGVARAESGERRVRSEWFPQLTASASYDRALASEFEGIFDNAGPPCIPFALNPQAPLGERVSEIERALRDCPPAANPFGGGGSGGEEDGDSALPFGRANTYRLNLFVAQNVYTGGRLAAQQTQARLARAGAGLTLTTTRAQLALDVAQAYFDAVLSDRLVAIAEATLAQAESTAEQVRQQREAGRVAEFDLLRAQVTRDSQRPEVIRRRNARDLAHLRLKQLLEIPLEEPLQLASNLEDSPLAAPAERFAGALAATESSPPGVLRTAVSLAETEVRQREAAVRVVRSQRLPSVSVTSSYGRVGYPAGFPTLGDFRTNWTVGASAQVPLFTGGRIAAEEAAARADVAETEARLRLARELATLDEASSRLALANAQAAWEATAGTVQQAERAYEIAELRYREGLSTQLELSDARLLVQQAYANRVQAARDVQMARVRLALLPELPLDAGIAAGSQAQGAPAPQPQGAASQNAGAPAAPGGQVPGAGAARQ